MASFEPSAQQQRQREQERDARIQDALDSFGPLTATARNADGSVRVECAPGGVLTSLQLNSGALRVGAAALRRDILAAAKRATARANHRAEQAYSHAMGTAGKKATKAMGLTYDPRLLDEDDQQV